MVESTNDVLTIIKKKQSDVNIRFHSDTNNFLHLANSVCQQMCLPCYVETVLYINTIQECTTVLERLLIGLVDGTLIQRALRKLAND